MENLTKALVGLSGLAFLLAVIGAVFVGPMVGVAPEGFSRACTNLALIAIALSIGYKKDSTAI
ncbi:MAG: hypothetical protein ACE5JR_13600 [Gemmatimonadota bacterium]